jgi:hypothetical protein
MQVRDEDVSRPAAKVRQLAEVEENGTIDEHTRVSHVAGRAERDVPSRAKDLDAHSSPPQRQPQIVLATSSALMSPKYAVTSTPSSAAAIAGRS